MGKAISLVQYNIKAGTAISTLDLENFIVEKLDAYGCSAPFKEIDDYGFASCICINHEIVHARPNNQALIKIGDLVDIDFGVKLVDWSNSNPPLSRSREHASVIVDAATTFVAGSEKGHPLIQYCEAWRNAMVNRCIVGAKIEDLAKDLDKKIPNPNRYHIIPGYPGHGIGQNYLHVPPTVPSIPVSSIPTHWCEHQVIREGYKLKEGDVIAVEPIAAEKLHKKTVMVQKDPDGWREFFIDGTLCAHSEHTVLITRTGPEVIA
jgi:methionyl aminopeptidase